jgi:hypothetical protein
MPICCASGSTGKPESENAGGSMHDFRHNRARGGNDDQVPVRSDDVVGAVEVLAGPVVAHGGSRVRGVGGDYIAQANSGVEHGGHKGVAQHVWVRPWHPHTCRVGQVLEPTTGE